MDDARATAARDAATIAALTERLARRDAELARANETNAALRDALASAEARVAAWTARDRAAADAGREAESLAETRRELEEKTAELIRLKGVLRGKLLARVTEEVDAARRSADALG